MHIGNGIYYRPQCIIGHWIFSTAERISLYLARICSTDNTKTGHSKTRRTRFFLPWREDLKCTLRKYILTDMDSYFGYKNQIWPWLLYLKVVSFLITLSRNRSPKSNNWGTRLPLTAPYRLINYRPPFGPKWTIINGNSSVSAVDSLKALNTISGSSSSH